jgi:hypothetical protein
VGNGGFGTAVLAKRKLPGGPEERYAIKALNKASLSSASLRPLLRKL